MKNDVAEAAVDYFASRSHEAWRRNFLKAHPAEKNKPRMRKRGGVMVDVNQPWRTLHPKAKADNKIAAYDALNAIQKFPKDREAAADYVHKCWIRRNKGDASQPKKLFQPYARLPELEKDKDRAHVDNMKKALAAVSAKAKPRKARKKSAKRAPPAPHSVEFDAKTWRALETLAQRLSKMSGRTVTAADLARAGVETMLALYGKAKAKV